MRLDHDIFNKPLASGAALTNDYEAKQAWQKPYAKGGTWLVHSGEFPKVDVGVVSDGYGFEDSPDCERISSGVNSKGPQAVAIGRQANMLQWGFYGGPDRMTDSAKKAFLNAIVYIKKFDGHRPLVRKAARSRAWHLGYIQMARDYGDKMSDGIRKYLRGRFPQAVIEQHGLDPEALEKWYRENEEYFYAAGRGEFQVDEDLKKLGVSNRKPEFLTMLMQRLTRNPKDELGLRLAKRYLDKTRATAVLAHLTKHSGKLFFSDTGGFKWLVDTR